MIRKLNPRLSDRGGLFVFTYRLLLVHIMWTFSPNACYYRGLIFQHQTMLNVSIHFLNVSDVVCKTVSAFENFEYLLPLTFLDTEAHVLTGFLLFCVLSLPNPLLPSMIQRICRWCWFYLNVMFLDNGPCLGYRKPNQPYRWLSYKQVSLAHCFGVDSFVNVAF